MLKFNKTLSNRINKKRFLTFFILITSLTAFAQKSMYDDGQLFYKTVDELATKGDYDRALKIIDTLRKQNSFFSSDEPYYLKGHVYRIKFKTSKSIQDQDSSFLYLSKALSMGRELDANIISNLKYLCNSNHNLAANALEQKQLDSAEFYYSRTKKILLIVDSSRVSKSDIEFQLACSSVCTKLYEENREKNIAYFDKGINYNQKILLVDSNNKHAVYNIMVLYYNKAVTDLRKAEYCKQVDVANTVDWTDPQKPIPSIEKLLECIKPEEFSKYNFTPALKKALPYALKMYQLDPSNKHVLEALVGITFATNDTKSANKYKKELQKLN